MAQGADQGDDVEAELPLWQSKRTFFLRTQGVLVEFAGGIHAAADHQPESNEPIERSHSAQVMVADPQLPGACLAVIVEAFEPELGGGRRAGLVSGHMLLRGRDLVPILATAAPSLK